MGDDGKQVTKELVKERLAHLGGLIQMYRGEKIGKSQLGMLVKEAIESSGITFYGTEMDRIESAIARYEHALETERVRKYVADAMDEMFGLAMAQFLPDEFTDTPGTALADHASETGRTTEAETP